MTLDDIGERIDRLEHLMLLNSGKLMTEAEAADMLGISEQTLRVKIRYRDRIRFVEVGGDGKRAGRIMYRKQDVIDYAEQNLKGCGV